MVGRACLGRPWIFAEICDMFSGLPPRPPPQLGTVLQLATEHARSMVEWHCGPLVRPGAGGVSIGAAGAITGAGGIAIGGTGTAGTGGAGAADADAGGAGSAAHLPAAALLPESEVVARMRKLVPLYLLGFSSSSALQRRLLGARSLGEWEAALLQGGLVLRNQASQSGTIWCSTRVAAILYSVLLWVWFGP